MIRFLSILALLCSPLPALAADDGGFGTARFTNQSAAALSDDASSDFDPASIEPAAGTEDQEEVTDTVDVTPEPTITPDETVAPLTIQ